MEYISKFIDEHALNAGLDAGCVYAHKIFRNIPQYPKGADLYNHLWDRVVNDFGLTPDADNKYKGIPEVHKLKLIEDQHANGQK